MPTRPLTGAGFATAALLASLCMPAAGQESPPQAFGEEVVVQETSVVALPPGGGSAVPEAAAVTVTIGDLPQRVTRVERVLDDNRGEWQFVIYLDSRLAGARTRFLASLALGQRAESLAALGTVEVLEADANKPVLERTGSWQRIEAALLSHALEARHRLARGDRAVEQPGWEVFYERLDRLLEALEDRGGGGPRALLLPSDGLYSLVDAEALERIVRTLAGSGWVTIPMPWGEEPSEASAARLSEFESWKQAAEGRDVSANTRRYVIDLGRVVRHLRGAGDSPPAEIDKMEPQLVALQNLAGPTSGLLAARDSELKAALSNLARRWRIWFQAAGAEGGEPRPLQVLLDGERLEAPAWLLPPLAE